MGGAAAVNVGVGVHCDETEPAYNANYYYYRHGRTWQTCNQNRSAAHLETASVSYLHATMRIL